VLTVQGDGCGWFTLMMLFLFQLADRGLGWVGGRGGGGG